MTSKLGDRRWLLVALLSGIMIAMLLVAGCAPRPTTDSGSAQEASEVDGLSKEPETPPVIEATSLLGQPLARPEIDDEFRLRQEALLAEAERDLADDPGDSEAGVWIGRRLGYLGRYGEAIAHYSAGLEEHPDDPWLIRHRGHRYITVRQLDRAVADFEHATMLVEGQEDVVEPDGLPNALGIPTSSLHTNLWYHLGLAHYLRGDWLAAVEAYARCHAAATNDDMRVAATYWWYLALRRLERDGEARRLLEPITPELELIENHDYHDLLLVFRGDGDGEALLEEAGQAGGGAFATLGYGLGAWHLVEGRADPAQEIWSAIVAGPAWPSFGHIAAEAELARGGSPQEDGAG